MLMLTAAFYWLATHFVHYILLPIYAHERVTGLENLPHQGPLIIASNHLDDTDPGVLTHVADLVHDPGESHNLFQEKKSVASSFHEHLLSLLSRYSSSQEAEMAQALSPDVVERLNSLGYAGVSAQRRSPPDSGPDPKDRIEEYEDYGHALTLAAAGRYCEV